MSKLKLLFISQVLFLAFTIPSFGSAAAGSPEQPSHGGAAAAAAAGGNFFKPDSNMFINGVDQYIGGGLKRTEQYAVNGIKLPAAPVIHSYHMATGNDQHDRKDFGSPTFLFSAKTNNEILANFNNHLFEKYFIDPLIKSNICAGMRIPDCLRDPNIDVFVVVQNNPWGKDAPAHPLDNVPLLLRPQYWVYPDTPLESFNVDIDNKGKRVKTNIFSDSGISLLPPPKDANNVDIGNNEDISVHNNKHAIPIENEIPVVPADGLPDKFDPAIYLALNPDLQEYINTHPVEIAGDPHRWAINNYLTDGKQKGKKWYGKWVVTNRDEAMMISSPDNMKIADPNHILFDQAKNAYFWSVVEDGPRKALTLHWILGDTGFETLSGESAVIAREGLPELLLRLNSLASVAPAHSAPAVGGLPAGFDPSVYVSLNKDLQDASKGMSQSEVNAWATQHYLTNGMKEGRSYRPLGAAAASSVATLPAGFDPSVYVSLNQDLQDASKGMPPSEVNAWATQHYLTNGLKEGRAYRPAGGAAAPSVAALPADFNPRVYISLNKDLQEYARKHHIPDSEIDTWATQHYTHNGRDEGRSYK